MWLDEFIPQSLLNQSTNFAYAESRDCFKSLASSMPPLRFAGIFTARTHVYFQRPDK